MKHGKRDEEGEKAIYYENADITHSNKVDLSQYINLFSSKMY